jgi:type II secretory pathway component PulC
VNFSRLFSNLGFQAIDIILGINTKDLKESDLRKLTRLIIAIEMDSSLEEKVYVILKNHRDTDRESLVLELLEIAETLENGMKLSNED